MQSRCLNVIVYTDYRLTDMSLWQVFSRCMFNFVSKVISFVNVVTAGTILVSSSSISSSSSKAIAPEHATSEDLYVSVDSVT